MQLIPPFTTTQMVYAEGLKGLQRARGQVGEASLAISRGELTPRNFVELNVGLYSFKANALVIRSADQMTGTLLNTFA